MPPVSSSVSFDAISRSSSRHSDNSGLENSIVFIRTNSQLALVRKSVRTKQRHVIILTLSALALLISVVTVLAITLSYRQPDKVEPALPASAVVTDSFSFETSITTTELSRTTSTKSTTTTSLSRQLYIEQIMFYTVYL